MEKEEKQGKDVLMLMKAPAKMTLARQETNCSIEEKANQVKELSKQFAVEVQGKEISQELDSMKDLTVQIKKCQQKEMTAKEQLSFWAEVTHRGGTGQGHMIMRGGPLATMRPQPEIMSAEKAADAAMEYEILEWAKDLAFA
ncbi:hypothetical protein J3B02_006017, partial [Coemansia erecta]